MKKLILATFIIAFAGTAFSQTESENKSAISAIKTELRSTSEKGKVKELSSELKIREGLDQAFKNNDKSLIAKKKAELHAIEEEKTGSSRKKSGDYNSSRSNNTKKR